MVNEVGEDDEILTGAPEENEEWTDLGKGDSETGTRKRQKCRAAMKNLTQCEQCEEKIIKTDELNHWFLLVAPAVHVCGLKCFRSIAAKIKEEADANPDDDDKQHRRKWCQEIEQDYLS